MDIIGKIRALVEADTSQFDAALGKAERVSDEAAENISNSLDLMGIGKGLAGVGAGLSVGITAPLVVGFNNARQAATEFNSAMANVASLMPGNRDRVNELGLAVNDLSKEIGTPASALTGGLYQIISAFGDTSDTVAILTTNTKLAAAGLSSVEEAVALTSAVTKGYGDTSATAVEHVADLAMKTVEMGQTTFPQLAGAIGMVVPTANQLGVSVEELFGFMATFTGVTGGASEVATQLNGALSAMMKPSTEMRDAIQALGYESGSAMISQLGLKGSIEALTGVAGGSEEQLGKMFGRVEALRVVFPTTGTQAETLTQKIAAMSQASGTADAAFREQTQGVNAAGIEWEKMKASFDAVWRALGSALTPALTALLPVVQNLAGVVEDAVNWFQTWPEPLQNATLAIAAIAAAIGPLLIVAGSLTMAWATMAPAIGTITAVLGPLTLGVTALAVAKGALLAAAVAVSAALYWPQVQELWENLTELKDAVTDVTTGINETKESVDSILPQLGNFVGFVKDVVTWTLQTISPLNLLNEQVKAVTSAIKYLTGEKEPLTDAVAANSKAVTENATALGQAAIEASAVGLEERKLARQLKQSETAAAALAKQTAAMASRKKAAAAEAKRLKDEQEAVRKEQERAQKVAEFYTQRIQDLDRSYKDMNRAILIVSNQLFAGEKAWDDNTKAVVALRSEVRTLTKEVMPPFIEETVRFENAMKSMGITTVEEAQKMTADMQAAYDEIVASDRSTEFQQNSALLKLYKAMAEESKLTTGQIPDDLQDSIRKMETVVNGPQGLAKVRTPFENFSREVSTIVTNLSQDLAKSLFDGDLSFKEKGIAALRKLGEATVAQFTQPFIDAVIGPNGLIIKALNPLFDKLGSITSSFFGVGSSAMGSAAGAGGSAAGTAAQAGGQLAGAAVTGVVSAVTGIVSAISDIFGNFQQQRMIRALGQIEENTRFLKVDFVENKPTLKELLWDAHNYLYYIHDDFRTAGGVRQRLDAIADQTYWAMLRLDSINNDMINRLDSVISKLDQTITVHATLQIDGQRIAEQVVQTQGRRQALQGVAF